MKKFRNGGTSCYGRGTRRGTERSNGIANRERDYDQSVADSSARNTVRFALAQPTHSAARARLHFITMYHPGGVGSWGTEAPREGGVVG